MQRLPRVCIDFETFPIEDGSPSPAPVVLGVCFEKPGSPGVPGESYFFTDSNLGLMETTLRQLLESEDYEIVGQSIRYDLGVAFTHFPRLRTAIFDALADGRVRCTELSEKLLNLADHGKLTYLYVATDEDGYENEDAAAGQMIRYRLMDLASNYLGLDLSEDKDDLYAWRSNYYALSGLSWDQYPEDAQEYLKDDIALPLVIAEEQDRRNRESGAPDAFQTLSFQVWSDFSLAVMGNTGMRPDPVMRAKVQERLKRALAADKISLLIEEGIVIEAQPSKPYGNGAKDKATGLPKMTKPKPRKTSNKQLQAHVKRICAAHGMKCETSEKSGKPSTKASFLMRVAAGTQDPVVEQWLYFQTFQKLLNTYLPQQLKVDPATGKRLPELADRVYTNFSAVVETGRTSSWTGSLIACMQGQNQHPEMRPCYIPDEPDEQGEWWFLSSDYSSLELVSLAQRCYTLFGYSVLRDNINAGIDSHGYLASFLAGALSPEFGEITASLDVRARYEVFNGLKKAEDEDKRKFHKHWRTFAKPTGLGYPGGLGPRTFVEYAYGTYGVKTNIEEARQLKDLWLEAYPEMSDYFAFVTRNMEDPRHRDRYVYRTPLGMTRSNASYCATCNGFGMQSPSAEGAKMAVNAVLRACYDPTVGSILYGNFRPTLFIHDEIFGLVRAAVAHDVAQEVERIMIREMEKIMTDVAVRCETALMDRWYKQAEPVFDDKGRLTVWRPKEELEQ